MKVTAIIDGNRIDLDLSDSLNDTPEFAAEVAFSRLNHGSGDTLPGYTGRSFSVGDLVEVGDVTLRCEPTGWMRLTPDEVKFCYDAGDRLRFLAWPGVGFLR